jgi:adenylate cyclase
MESLATYIPMDRRQAIVRAQSLPDRTSGAVLFADISGFTPLTEALMQEFGPRGGAEELTKQLNAVYGALITQVHHYLGSVIVFSGDAITCWFDDNTSIGSGQAGLRATACALNMQQVMRRFSEVGICPGITISLAIKIAVAVGPVRRFTVGDPQIQVMDVLAGETLDRMAKTEKQANQGQVVLGSKAMARLGGQVAVVKWREATETGQRLAIVGGLTRPVEADPWPDLPPSWEEAAGEQVRSWLLPPVYERLSTDQGRFLAELRPATALFLKFGGLDYDHDDAAGEKLDMYVRWVQNVLVRHESYLLQLTTGDKGSYLYAAFGAPLAHDDDSVRAVAAALELRTIPPEVDFISGVQIGISQGRMRAGAYGGPMRRTYGVLGDEVNVAARLMGKAESGQIWVSERVADAATKHYRFDYVGAIPLKGKTEPLPVYTPAGRSLPSLQRPAGLFTGLLVGREIELARMEQVLGAVLGGTGQILRVEGVAGVGKSRLTAELIGRAIGRGLRVALGNCHGAGQAVAYEPWRQIFRTLLGLTGDPGEQSETGHGEAAQVEATVSAMNPDWLPRLPLLGDLLDLPIPDNETTTAFDPKLRRESLLALAVDMIRVWASARPLLLVIEDAHWMDEISLELTLALGRAIARTPTLLLLVHRPPIRGEQPLLPELDPLPSYTLLDLCELSPEEIRTLATGRLKGELSALALALVQAQVQGNPFFAEEMIDALRESGGLYLHDDGVWDLAEPLFNALREANCLVREDGRWRLAEDSLLLAADLGLPDSIHGVVLSRVDRLPEPHKLTLKVAGVVGRVFEFDVLADSHPTHPEREALLREIEVLEERDFTRAEMPPPHLTFMFKHNITREVVYQTLLEEQQRELHQAVGEALESWRPGAVERLAYHYSHSPARDKAMFYLDRAARKAQREYANETALNHYNQALALETRWKWLIGKVELLHILGLRDDERAALEALAAIPEAPVSEVAYLLGQYYEAVGDYIQAQTSIKQALAAHRRLANVAGEVRCLTQLGWVAGRQGDYARAKDWYTQALEMLRGDPAYADEEARALNGLGVICGMQGDYAWAEECFERALALSNASGNRIGEAQALNNLGIAAFYQCHFAEAQAYHRRALETRRAIGDRAGEGTSLLNLAQSTRDAGDYGQALLYLSEALAIGQTIGDRWGEANVRNDLGVLHLLVGDWPTAQMHFHHGLELCKEIGDRAGQAYVLCNLGQTLRDTGDLDAAEELLTDSLVLAQEQDDKHLAALCLSHLGMVSLRAGRLDQAMERAGAALAARSELGLPLWATADLATLAAASLASGNTDNALEYARQALTTLDGCGGAGPEFPQRDYFVCYEVLSATGQAEAARSALQSAHTLVIAKAEKITDPALRQSFLERVPFNREIVREYTM